MDVATGLMMSAAALFSEVESPLGYAKVMGEGEDATRQDYVDRVAGAFRALEEAMAARPAADRQAIYMALRKGILLTSGQEGP